MVWAEFRGAMGHGNRNSAAPWKSELRVATKLKCDRWQSISATKMRPFQPTKFGVHPSTRPTAPTTKLFLHLPSLLLLICKMVRGATSRAFLSLFSVTSVLLVWVNFRHDPTVTTATNGSWGTLADLNQFAGISSSSSSSTESLQATIQQLEARNKDLEYRLAMMQARQPQPLLGPRLLKDLPADIYDRFQDYDMDMKVVDKFAKYGVAKDQVPQAGWSFMEFLGIGKGFKPEWSQELIDTLVNIGKENGDFSCKHYPKSVLQLYEAMERVMELEKDKKLSVLVAGSISPWVEAVVISRPGIQLRKLVTTDYNPIEIHSDQIEFVSMEDLKQNRPEPLFDLVVSYSSIEHDGLGRYGDPINPAGDFCAIQEYSLMLREGGYLILGIPQTRSSDGRGQIKQNGQRIYSNARAEKLIEGFTRIGDPITVPETDGWRYQPVNVLRKN